MGWANRGADPVFQILPVLSNFGSLNPANTEEVLFDFSFPNTALVFSRQNGKGSYVQDGTHYIGIDADSTSLGINIFGFDCFTAGTAVLITEEVDDDGRAASSLSPCA